MRMDREQIKDMWPNVRDYAGNWTLYAFSSQQGYEFWDWCTNHGVEIQFEGHWEDRSVFRVVNDPCPLFTALRWS